MATKKANVKRPRQLTNLVKKGVPPRIAKKIAGKKGK